MDQILVDFFPEGGTYSTPWNNLYTVAFRFIINYKTGKEFEIESDDDCWVFFNGKLAIDNGGYHIPVSNAVINLDKINTNMGLGLVDGQDYEVAVFMADRMPYVNRLKIRTNCVVKQPGSPIVVNKDTDGDGILDETEAKVRDTDKDGQVDCIDTDDDGDGIVDIKDQDDDGDSIPDYLEVYHDTDNDGIIDSKDPDDDNDGEPDETDIDDDNDGIDDKEDI